MSKDTQTYKILVDETCPEHGGKNFVYQNDDENFPRMESICEGCTNATPHVPSPELVAQRQARSHERPARQ